MSKPHDEVIAQGASPIESTRNDASPDDGVSIVNSVNASGGNEKAKSTLIPLGNHDLPPWNSNILPPVVAEFTEALAAFTETPPELAGTLSLAVLATCVQGKYVVQPKPGYTESLSLFIAAALPSGERKTAVLNALIRPVRRWETEQRMLIEPARQEALSKRATDEARIGALRKKAARQDKRDETHQEIRRLEQNLPVVPVVPRLFTQDVTPERLAGLLQEQNERIACLSDEGGIFDVLKGRYSSNGQLNLDVLLQGYTGSPVRIDRKGSDPVTLEHPAITLGLSPQPDVIAGLAERREFRGRGLLGRFLWALPNSKIGYRTNDGPPIPQHTAEDYDRLIKELLSIQPSADPQTITLSHAAVGLYQDFFLHVETDMRDGSRFEHLRDWTGKLPGTAARIAALFQCVEYAEGEAATIPISGETMNRAIHLCEILAIHALAAFDLIGADPALMGARKVWGWICSKHSDNNGVFKARGCFRALQGSFKSMKDINPAFQVLEERGYIYDGTPNDGRVGRPSVVYCITTEAEREIRCRLKSH